MAIDHFDSGLAPTIPVVSNGKQGGFFYLRAPDIITDMNAVNINAAAVVWTPADGQKLIRFMGGSISVSVAGSVTFTDGTSGAVKFRTPALLANTPYTFDLGNGRLLDGGGATLKAIGPAASTITGTLFGTEDYSPLTPGAPMGLGLLFLNP